MSNTRVDKLNAEFQKLIYEIISTKVKDPRLTEMFTITKVSCDKELTFAKVYFSIYSTDEKKAKDTFIAIKNCENFVRHNLLKAMRIRTVPELCFVEDKIMQDSSRIDEIFKELENEKHNN